MPRMRHRLPLLLFAAALARAPAAQEPAPPAPAAAAEGRLHTDRPHGAQLIRLPKEDDAFGFVVFGDRTGGPAAGIEVLKQAVADTNLLDPDLVMTVGDLVQGYNAADEWQQQAAEYKAAMQALRMPWFPVAGNHDIYWRGAGRPPGEHERDFEATFGPLWYAFEHKRCWFVVLHSDEGDPATGKRDFNDPATQRVSPQQFAWLEQTLHKANGARHVFVFLHHPRWITAKYGDDWDRVHTLLAKAGNVRAVFAGHIHRMRYDGRRDGIEYYTVASVGAHLEFEAPRAGYLHQFHVVTVRPQGIQVAAVPVGAVLDPKQITAEVSEDVAALHRRLGVDALAAPAIDRDGAVDGLLELAFDNPARRPIELEVVPQPDAPWAFSPDHTHLVVGPGKRGTATFAVRRPAAAAGQPFALPRVELRCDYLAAGARIGVPARTVELPWPAPAGLADAAGQDAVLRLDGKAACLELPPAALQLPDGPFTAEAWLCADAFGERTALLAKTQSSEWALFVNDGGLDFSVHLDGRYRSAGSKPPVLTPGRWHHVAGVFDGEQVRAYVDGRLVGSAAASGKRKANQLPLYVGADPDGDGAPTSFFRGAVDEVRISKVARYRGERFEPARRCEADADTVLLLHLDQDHGPWAADASAARAHPLRRGTAHCAPAASEPAGR